MCLLVALTPSDHQTLSGQLFEPSITSREPCPSLTICSVFTAMQACDVICFDPATMISYSKGLLARPNLSDFSFYRASQYELRSSTQLDDAIYMKEAIRLARKGHGYVSPNPMVGALLVRERTIIGQGYHRRYGGPHAEVNALESFQGDPRGATLYVTLEPCSHHGKTPPCVDVIIQRGIHRVVVGTEDPNPLVGGQGIRTLAGHGIEVRVGVLEQACRDLNPSFFKYFEKGLPYVTLKIAQSLDGRIATETGSSQWITSPRSLRLGHRLRATHDGVMVGIDTVITDDPSLTVRLVRGRNPLRLIMDSRLRVTLGSKVLTDGHASHTLIVTTDRSAPHRIEKVQALGARVLCVAANSEGRVNLPDTLRTLAGDGVTSILVEGGAKIATSFVRARLVDRLVAIIGPKLIGKGIEAMGDLGISQIAEAPRLSIESVRRLDDDLIVTARMT